MATQTARQTSINISQEFVNMQDLGPHARPNKSEYAFYYFLVFIKNFFNVNLFLRERVCEQGRAEREGDTESEVGSRLWLTAQSWTWGSNS